MLLQDQPGSGLSRAPAVHHRPGAGLDRPPPREGPEGGAGRLPQGEAAPDDHEVLRVVVEGEEGGRPVTYTLDAFADADPARGLSAVAIDPGAPPSVVAQMIAAGKIRERGVRAPAPCLGPAP